MSKEALLSVSPFDLKVARTNYHVELFFDENSKIDLRERMLRVIRQSIVDDLLNNDMLS